MVPMFPQLSAGSDDLDYLALARQYQEAAADLPVSYINGQINWPVYTLLFHGCELALKAYCKRHAPHEKVWGHSFKKMYGAAMRHGLKLRPEIITALDELENMHDELWPRYPDNRSGPIRDVSQLASDLLDELIRLVSASF